MISAKVIKASRNIYTNTTICTMELDYPRFIHSEFMTHRLFSRNAQSSRAVPVNKTVEVNKDYVKPLVWGRNKSGMSSTEVLTEQERLLAEEFWDTASSAAFTASSRLSDIGLHKQWANRLTEPFSRIKVIVTATEWDNFFWLRNDPDAAQPEMVELAVRMKEAYDKADVTNLKEGEWHLPYIETEFWGGEIWYLDSEYVRLQIDDAIKISASCCAQVSYRKLDESKVKALEIYERLFSGSKPHLSPVEHQALCFDPAIINKQSSLWPPGISHVDRKGSFWSGNLKDFIQYRKILEST